MEHYFICGKFGCDFSTTDKSDKRCGKCGSTLVERCPKCSSLINQASNKYCSKCGEYLKIIPDPF